MRHTQEVRATQSRTGQRTAHHTWLSAWLVALMLAAAPVAQAQTPRSAAPATAETRCFAIEVYDSGPSDVRGWAEAALKDRTGVTLRVFDVNDEEGRQRHEAICKHFRLDTSTLPLVYGCAQYVANPKDEASLKRKLDEMLTMTVFVRAGCPRCAAAKAHLQKVQRKYPALKIVYHDVVSDRTATSRMEEVARRYRKSAVSVPVYHFCDQVHVGWDSEAGQGRRVETALEKWAPACKKPAPPPAAHRSPAPSTSRRGIVALPVNPAPRAACVWPMGTAAVWSALIAFQESHPRDPPAGPDSSHEEPYYGKPSDGETPPALPLPLPADEDLPELPLPAVDGSDAEGLPPSDGDEPPPDGMDVPLFGSLSVSSLGMPAFTIAIGLIDGFNPCAMWVLLFLLSILVNLQDRWKILAVAGTFVFISGLVYFAFMAAWLHTSKLFPYEEHLQIALGVLATIIGLVHIKDFFAFHKGITFSIPESAKPRIYERVRRIIAAENVLAAVVGAATLAALVNLLELLCTAGLPSAYTWILTKQERPLWEEYGYLLLYNLAYMFDDAVVLTIAVVTLGKYKLQERGGRWLKLLGGVVVLSLGLVLLFKPEWLNVLRVT